MTGNRLPLCDRDADRLMAAIRAWGSEVRREVRHLHQGDMTQHLFRAGKADAAYLEIIRLVRGDSPRATDQVPDSYADELTLRTAIPASYHETQEAQDRVQRELKR